MGGREGGKEGNEFYYQFTEPHACTANLASSSSNAKLN